MKLIIKLLWIGLVSLMGLTGCGQSAASPPTEEPVVETLMTEEPSQTGAQVEAPPVTAPPEIEAPPVPATPEEATPLATAAPENERSPIDPTDVTLVANTGRPQFLNSFATW